MSINIRTAPCAVWLITTAPDKKQYIEVTARDCPVETVIDIFKRTNPDGDNAKFVVQNITVGGPFRIKHKQPEHLQWFSGDARKVDHKGKIHL